MNLSKNNIGNFGAHAFNAVLEQTTSLKKFLLACRKVGKATRDALEETAESKEIEIYTNNYNRVENVAVPTAALVSNFVNKLKTGVKRTHEDTQAKELVFNPQKNQIASVK